jgi:hypothetical protein
MCPDHFSLNYDPPPPWPPNLSLISLAALSSLLEGTVALALRSPRLWRKQEPMLLSFTGAYLILSYPCPPTVAHIMMFDAGPPRTPMR